MMNLQIGDSVVIKPINDLPKEEELNRKYLADQIVTVKSIINLGNEPIIMVYTGKDDTTMVIDKSWILTKISMTEDGVSLEDI